MCKYKKKCKYYQDDSFTCNKAKGEDLNYCGKYREYEEIR